MSPQRPPRDTDDGKKTPLPAEISAIRPDFEAFPPPLPSHRASPHTGPGGQGGATARRPTRKDWPRVSTGGPEPRRLTVIPRAYPAPAEGADGVTSDGSAAGSADGGDGSACADVGPRPRPGAATPSPTDLPVWLRITLIALGFVLLAVGVAGLVLPGLQGILTILLGLALLSLVSHQAYRFLCWCLGPWPNLRDRVMGYRVRTFSWLNAKLGSVGASAVGAEESPAGEGDE